MPASNDKCYLLEPKHKNYRYYRIEEQHFYEISPECVKHVSGNKFHPLISNWTNKFARKFSS